MDTVWTTLISKVANECGLIGFISWSIIGILSHQLARTRAAWEAREAVIEKLRETERERYLKLVTENATMVNKDLSIATEKMEKVEGMLLMMTNNRG